MGVESVSASSPSLDDYAQRVSRRIRVQLAGPSVMFGLLFASAAAATGWRQAAVAVAALLAVNAVVIGSVFGFGRLRERRRRLRGEDPSWTAFASRSLAHGHHSHGSVASRDLGEVFGRLSRTSTGYEWVERRVHQSEPARLSWQADAVVETRRVWGPGSPGLVRFVRTDGEDAILTLSGLDDFDRDRASAATCPPPDAVV